MIEQLMERTDPGTAVVDERALEAVFAAGPLPRPAPKRVPVGLRWAGYALAAAAVIAGILAVPLMISGPIPAPVGVGDYPYYSTQAELVDAATAILVVDVGSERPGSYEGIDVEVKTAHVVADADGTHAVGSLIEIKEMPGEDALAIGQRYVVFVVEYDAVPASLINPTQGAYLVRNGGEAWPQSGNEIQLSRDLLDSLGLRRTTAD